MSRSPSPIPIIQRRKPSLWDVMVIDDQRVLGAAPTLNPQQQRTPHSPSCHSHLLSGQQRRLYVGNLPPTVSDMELIEFFNTIMVNSGAVTQKGNPVVSATINREKAYAFIEFRTTEEASVGMSLDGITLQTHSLRVRRPKDYLGEEGTVVSPHSWTKIRVGEGKGGGAPAAVLDSPHKIYIGGLNPILSEVCIQYSQMIKIL